MSALLRTAFLGLAVAVVPLFAAQSSEASDIRVRVGPVSAAVGVNDCGPVYGVYRPYTIYRPGYDWSYWRHHHYHHGHHYWR